MALLLVEVSRRREVYRFVRVSLVSRGLGFELVP